VAETHRTTVLNTRTPSQPELAATMATMATMATAMRAAALAAHHPEAQDADRDVPCRLRGEGVVGLLEPMPGPATGRAPHLHAPRGHWGRPEENDPAAVTFDGGDISRGSDRRARRVHVRLREDLHP
jgi:hypothetical protein